MQPDLFAASRRPRKLDVKISLVEMKQEGQTTAQLLEWLQEQGIKAGRTTLEGRLRKWGIRRRYLQVTRASSIHPLSRRNGPP